MDSFTQPIAQSIVVNTIQWFEDNMSFSTVLNTQDLKNNNMNHIFNHHFEKFIFLNVFENIWSYDLGIKENESLEFYRFFEQSFPEIPKEIIENIKIDFVYENNYPIYNHIEKKIDNYCKKFIPFPKIIRGLISCDIYENDAKISFEQALDIYKEGFQLNTTAKDFINAKLLSQDLSHNLIIQNKPQGKLKI